MFDKALLQKVLEQYKRDFVLTQWEDEKYKWEAVKCFQDNWYVEADDFADMLTKSLSKTYNLLASANNFPAKMITEFAQTASEEVRSMFIVLFDERKDVYERIETFKMRSSMLLEQHSDGNRQHYQYENAITTYLWLRYPDKYYIYKYSEVKAVADVLKSGYYFKKGAYADNIRHFYRLYDEICQEIKGDTELVRLLKGKLTDSCYPDPELRTLTLDVSFYISQSYSQGQDAGLSKAEWFPAQYDPGLSVEDWVCLLNDGEVFSVGSLEIMKRMKDYGGAATCTQLSTKYGESVNFYNVGASSLAHRVADTMELSAVEISPGEERWWPVLFIGKEAGEEEEGVFVWKLRDELSQALDQTDLSDVELYALEDRGRDGCRYWWLNASPSIWSFSDMAVGGTQSYTLYNDNGNKRRIFQNFLDARAGDMLICYESNPVKQIVAIGKIIAEQDGEEIFFEKLEGLSSPIDYQVLKGYPELEGMEFFTNPNGSLFKLTREEFDFIMDLIREENSVQNETHIESYSKEDFLDEVYMSEQRFKTLVSVLKNKKNIILQGAPGVGKTFIAERLAYSIMGKKDDSRIRFVQFHQNYSYEDFVMGYKPVENGFELKYGVFYHFCQEASDYPEKNYFFIIDEINRGNMSKIFGELLMLIERGYRGKKAALAYNGRLFSVPENIYIIGMMNTADRSLAMIDYALRRRFSFFDMEPGFDSEGFIRYQNALDNEIFNKLILKVKELNDEMTSLLVRAFVSDIVISVRGMCARMNGSMRWWIMILFLCSGSIGSMK